MTKKSVLGDLHISKVIALNAQQAKFFVVISRGRLFILTPFFPLNGLSFFGAVPTDEVSRRK